MTWSKPSDALITTFAETIPDDARAERRKMFGFPCCFAGGNMFAGLWQDSMVLRLPEAERETLIQLHGAQPFEPMGRRMREYILVPADILADPARLRAWVDKSFAYALSLPEKAAKPPRAKKEPAPKTSRQAAPRRPRTVPPES